MTSRWPESSGKSNVKHFLSAQAQVHHSLLLPTSNQLLKPKIPVNVDQKLKLQKAKQSEYYNKGTKELEELRSGDIVRIQPQKSQFGKKKEWTRARVKGKVDIRSYQVRTEDGRAYRRNRRHLRRTRETKSNGEVETMPPPRAASRPATPDSSGEQLSVQPATSSTTANKGKHRKHITRSEDGQAASETSSAICTEQADFLSCDNNTKRTSRQTPSTFYGLPAIGSSAEIGTIGHDHCLI